MPALWRRWLPDCTRKGEDQLKYYDITQPLSDHTAAWPGDSPFKRQLTAKMAEGSSANVSQFSMSTHNGTHADAPFHYDNNGSPIDQIPVERYIGRAQVVSLPGRAVIGPADVASLELHQVERLLIRTLSCPDPNRFNLQFTYFDPEAVRLLAARGVRLIGTDAHSIDEVSSKDLPSHTACREAGVLILENLRMADVPDGEYELIALPLKLVGADGSPVRAVLRSLV